MTEPFSAAERTAQTNDIYRALGKFVVNFSSLVSNMEAGISAVIGVAGGTRSQQLINAILIELTADPLARAWRSVMMQAIDLTNDDVEVLTRLSTEISKMIKLRNDWSHGNWSVRHENELTNDRSRATLIRRKNSAKGVVSPSDLEGFPTAEYIEKAAAHVDFIADAVSRYWLIVIGKSAGDLADVRPSDHVRITKMGGGRRQVKSLQLLMMEKGDAWRSSEWP